MEHGLQKWMRPHVEDRLRKCLAIDRSNGTATKHMKERLEDLGISQNLSNFHISVPSCCLVQILRWSSSSSGLSAIASDSESFITVELSPPAEIAFRKAIDQVSRNIEEVLILKLHNGRIRVTDCFSPPRLFLCVNEFELLRQNSSLDFGAPRKLVEQGDITKLISAYSVWKQDIDHLETQVEAKDTFLREQYSPLNHGRTMSRSSSDEGYNSSAELVTQVLPIQKRSPPPRPKLQAARPGLESLREALRRKNPVAPKDVAHRIQDAVKTPVPKASPNFSPSTKDEHQTLAANKLQDENQTSPKATSSVAGDNLPSPSLNLVQNDFHSGSKRTNTDIQVPASSSAYLSKHQPKISASRATQISESQDLKETTEQFPAELGPEDKREVDQQEPQLSQPGTIQDIWEGWRRSLGTNASFPRNRILIPRAQENMFGEHSYYPPLPGKSKPRTNIPIALLIAIAEFVDRSDEPSPDPMELDEPTHQSPDEKRNDSDTSESEADEEVSASQWPSSPIQHTYDGDPVIHEQPQSSQHHPAQSPIPGNHSDEDDDEIPVFQWPSSPIEDARLPPDSSPPDAASKTSPVQPQIKDTSQYVQPRENTSALNVDLDLKYQSESNVSYSVENTENDQVPMAESSANRSTDTFSQRTHNMRTAPGAVPKATPSATTLESPKISSSRPVSKSILVHHTPPSGTKTHSSPIPPTEILTQIPSSPPNLSPSPSFHRKRAMITSPAKVLDSVKHPRLSSSEPASSLDSQHPTIKSLRRKEQFLTSLQNENIDNPTVKSLEAKARFLATLEKAKVEVENTPPAPTPDSSPKSSASTATRCSLPQGTKDNSRDHLTSPSLLTQFPANSSHPPPPDSNYEYALSPSQNSCASEKTSQTQSTSQLALLPDPAPSQQPATGSKLFDLLVKLGKRPPATPDPDVIMKPEASPVMIVKDEDQDEDQDEDPGADTWYRAPNTPFKIWKGQFNALPGVRRENARAGGWRVDLGRWGRE